MSALSKLCMVLAILMCGLVLAGSFAPAGASAASKKADACNPSFFGLEPWWKYLNNKPVSHKDINGKTYWSCEINEKPGQLLGKGSFILLIVLAVVDDLLRIAGLIAVVFVIIGGFKFMTAQGEPEAAASARKTIMFALVGLVVALIAVVIVSFIGNSIGS